jgi:hypothetical protein
MTEAQRWPRDAWLDALWEAEPVKPNERVVAYAYARYAGSGDISWCSWDELRKRTGIRSRDAISRAVSGLVDGGWLFEVERARQHYSTRYRLTIPAIQQSVSRTPGKAQQSVSRTAQPSGSRTPEPSAVRFPESSSPFHGPEQSDRELRQQQEQQPAHADAAADLVGKWRTNHIATGGTPYTNDVYTGMHSKAAALLAENARPEHIVAALARWDQRRDAKHPGLLPHLYRDVVNEAAKATRPVIPTATPAARPSTTDQRVAAIQALKNQLPPDGTNVFAERPALRALPGAAS